MTISLSSSNFHSFLSLSSPCFVNMPGHLLIPPPIQDPQWYNISTISGFKRSVIFRCIWSWFEISHTSLVVPKLSSYILPHNLCVASWLPSQGRGIYSYFRPSFTLFGLAICPFSFCPSVMMILHLPISHYLANSFEYLLIIYLHPRLDIVSSPRPLLIQRGRSFGLLGKYKSQIGRLRRFVFSRVAYTIWVPLLPLRLRVKPGHALPSKLMPLMRHSSLVISSKKWHSRR